jgi:hypothetical protein
VSGNASGASSSSAAAEPATNAAESATANARRSARIDLCLAHLTRGFSALYKLRMMPHPENGVRAFDPARALEFDLARGAVNGSSGDRIVLVPASVLDEMIRLLPAPDAARVARALGKACGARVAERLGGPDNVRDASIELVTSHFAGELAIAGVGAIRLERWGSALVVVVANPAIANGAALASILEGAISEATGRDLACAVIAREEGVARVLVASKEAIERAVGWLAEGTPWGDVLARLQRGEA